MRFHVRRSVLVVLVGALIAAALPALAQAAEAPGIEKFDAVTCNATHEECAQQGSAPFKEPKEPSKAEAEAEGYTQAGGHIPYGITDFKVATTGSFATGKAVPTAVVKHIRTDVAPGLATNPVAVPQCSMEHFGNKEELAGTGFYKAPECAGSTIGAQKAVVYAGEGKDLPLEGSVYNLEPSKGRAAEFGVALSLPIEVTKAILEKAFTEKGNPLGEATEKFLEAKQYFGHTLIEGNVEWGKESNGTGQGDYHDYFEINVSTALPLIRSRLSFKGRTGGDFLTNPTRCPGDTSTTLKLTDNENVTVEKTYTPPVSLSGCELVPFEPTLSITAATTGHDEADGFTTQVGLVQHLAAEEIASSQLKKAEIKLPEGMTLNPSAASGLTYCTPAQARIHSSTAGMACASSSELGTVKLEVPTLPAESLTGHLYLGGPESGYITGSPYTVFLDAESEKYGVSVRLKGEAETSESTGQVTVSFPENPEQPFTSLSIHLKEGALAPIANPVGCETATATGTFTPFTETSSKEVTSSFTPTGCSSPLSFSPKQSTGDGSTVAGAHTSYSFTLERPEGNQYLSKMTSVLPAGLVGAIPVVPLCAEPLAGEGKCPAASKIGTVTTLAGSGSSPYSLSGSVYLTTGYGGGPYGMSIAVPVVAGPFNLGTTVARATITVDKYSGRVIVIAYIPTIIHGGIPPRLRKLAVTIDRQGFLINPTSCGPLATESTVISTLGASASLSSPFQVAGCNTLKFKPVFKAASSAKTSKDFGASLETTINEPAGGANIRSVVVQLPIQMPSRLTTLQKSCPAATFEANPFTCPRGSLVGGARANTPVLPNKLRGPAYLVSHGNEAFPDLDLVLQADGVTVILTGNTKIRHEITTTTFASTPDVPVSSITVNLPSGRNSALAAYGSFCAKPLVMPVTMTGQNGLVVKQNTIIRVSDCPVMIVGHKVIGGVAYLTIRTSSPGRITGSGGGRGSVSRSLRTAVRATTLKIPLRLGRGHHSRLRVGFVSRKRGVAPSTAYVTVYVR